MAPQVEQCGGGRGLLFCCLCITSPTRSRAFRGHPRGLRVSGGSTWTAIGRGFPCPRCPGRMSGGGAYQQLGTKTFPLLTNLRSIP